MPPKPRLGSSLTQGIKGFGKNMLAQATGVKSPASLLKQMPAAATQAASALAAVRQGMANIPSPKNADSAAPAAPASPASSVAPAGNVDETPSPPQAVPAAPPSEAPSGHGTAGGLDEAFLLIYRLTAGLAGVVFIVMFVYGIVDVVLYFQREVYQRLQTVRDPNIFNKDTTDINALTYIQTNNPDDEPYHIFQQQRLIGTLFVIVGIMVIALGLQLGIFFSLKLYAVFTDREFTEHVNIPTNLLAAVAIMVVAASMIKSLYKQHFIKTVQESLRDLRSQLRDMRTFIYNNLTTNAPFLAALRTDNMDDVIDTMRTILESRDAESCMDKMTPCDGDVESMLFTLNMYSFLKMQVPESDPNYDKLSKLFDVDGVNARAVDPTMYFYYKQPAYVTNLYPVMRPKLKKYFGTKTGKPVPEDYTENIARERILYVNLNAKMQELNRKLSRMYNIASGKNKVRSYLFLYLFYITFFMALLVLLVIASFGINMATVRSFVGSMLGKLKASKA